MAANAQGNGKKAIGVVLLNLGGPEKLDDVRPFLFNLFSDRQIIRLGPAFLQKLIAWLIARRRAPKSKESYRLIGGSSPLNAITAQQADALQKSLAPHGDFTVTMAMRYWRPFAGEILAGLAGKGIRRLVALTLYPHYSVATTGSSLDDLHRTVASLSQAFEIAEIRQWPVQPDYIECLAGKIEEAAAKIEGPFAHIQRP